MYQLTYQDADNASGDIEGLIREVSVTARSKEEAQGILDQLLADGEKPTGHVSAK